MFFLIQSFGSRGSILTCLQKRQFLHLDFSQDFLRGLVPGIFLGCFQELPGSFPGDFHGIVLVIQGSNKKISLPSPSPCFWCKKYDTLCYSCPPQQLDEARPPQSCRIGRPFRGSMSRAECANLQPGLAWATRCTCSTLLTQLTRLTQRRTLLTWLTPRLTRLTASVILTHSICTYIKMDAIYARIFDKYTNIYVNTCTVHMLHVCVHMHVLHVSARICIYIW